MRVSNFSVYFYGVISNEIQRIKILPNARNIISEIFYCPKLSFAKIKDSFSTGDL